MTASLAIVTCVVALTAVADERTSPPVDEKYVFLSRVLKTPWPPQSGTPRSRVVRKNGRITQLRLDGMQIQQRDIEAIKEFEHVEKINFNYSTITDQQLADLKHMPALKCLVLDNTEIGNDGVRAISEFRSLRTLCMFKVKANAESVRALQKANGKLQIGYISAEQEEVKKE